VRLDPSLDMPCQGAFLGGGELGKAGIMNARAGLRLAFKVRPSLKKPGKYECHAVELAGPATTAEACPFCDGVDGRHVWSCSLNDVNMAA
jgi:hypothetical protein